MSDFKTVRDPFSEEVIKQSTIKLKKQSSVYDLIEKIMPENDLVCALSEIDKWAVLRSVLQWSLPPSDSWEESWNFPGQ